MLHSERNDDQAADDTMPLTKIKPQDETNPGGNLAANDQQSANDDGTVLADQADQNHYDDLYNSANQANHHIEWHRKAKNY